MAEEIKKEALEPDTAETPETPATENAVAEAPVTEKPAAQKASKTKKPANKKKKPAKKKKNGFFAKVKKFFKDYANELHQIVWCGKKQLLNNTWVVLVWIVAVAAVVGLLDYGFSNLLKLIAGAISIG